jgi:outer membrane protein assembly factor BamB
VALGPTGSVAWRWDAETGAHQLALATGLVLITTGNMTVGSGGTVTAPSGSLIALRSVSGMEAWRYAADGMVGAIEVSTDRLYAVVMKASSTSGGGSGSGSMSGPMDRTLVALDLNGHVLWTFGLDD